MVMMLEMAERTRVSEATVSRVLSGNGYVSQGAKNRVFQAVEGSGYRPSLLTRNLSTKSTQTLELVMTNTLYHNIYFSELLLHAARMTEEKGRQLLLANGKHSAEKEHQVIQYLLGLRCDAIIIYPRFLSVDGIDDIINAHSQPIMVLSRHLRESSSRSVWCDRKQTSFNAVIELITAGHQEITFLTDSMGPLTSIECLAGYKDALTQHGIAFNEKLIADGKWAPASGVERVETLLERGAKFGVSVASNGDMAIGTIKTLHERSVAVPEQVPIIGFDDIAATPYIIPALSNVKIPVTEVVQETTERPIFILDGGDFSPSKTFSGKLIRRGSLITLSR